MKSNIRLHRVGLMALAILSLLAAMWTGLERLGFALPHLQKGLFFAHGALMVCGFLGTLISLERAVALEVRSAYAAPILTGLGALALIIGLPDRVGALLITLGSAALIWDFILILKRQAALFTVTMALGALAFFAGNCAWLAGVAVPAMVSWWVGFLVLTVVGERLELSRLAATSRRRRDLFAAALALYVAGLIAASPGVSRGSTFGFELIGAGTIAFVFWIVCCDVARRTIREPGLPRFIAINLLAGCAWLGLNGILWTLRTPELDLLRYDALLHSVFLGFIFSMIFAHAPIIFPAVIGRALPLRRSFYLHVILLHLGLVLRIGAGDLGGVFWAYMWGGALNVAAIVVFMGNTARAIIAGQSPHRRADAAAPSANEANLVRP